MTPRYDPRVWLIRVLLIATAGCGRIAFDAGTGDAAGPADAAVVCATPVGHDEDGDGVDDTCDACPETGTSQVDADLDGVGDDCDPDQTIAHTRVLFDPFTGPRAEWLLDTRLQIAGDRLSFPAADVGAMVAKLLGAPGRAVFATAGRVTAVGDLGVDDHQVTIAFGPGSVGGYYCELYESAGGFTFQFTYTLDDVSFVQVDTVDLPGAFRGEFALTVVHAPPTMTCAARWLGQTYTIGGAIPAGLAANDATYVTAVNIDDELDYFVRLALP